MEKKETNKLHTKTVHRADLTYAALVAGDHQKEIKKLDESHWIELLWEVDRNSLLIDLVAGFPADDLAALAAPTQKQGEATVRSVWKEATDPRQNPDVAFTLKGIARLFTRPSVRAYWLAKQAKEVKLG